jgi:hypothetical protein
MKISIETPLPIMDVKVLTIEEVYNHPIKSYNPSEWNRIVDRFNNGRCTDVIFLERLNSPNQYHELFTIYTIPEGIRLINSLSYGASMTSAPFVRVHFDGDNISTEKPFQDGYVANNKNGREWMAHMSSNFGYIFSNKLELSKTETKTFEIPDMASA